MLCYYISFPFLFYFFLQTIILRSSKNCSQRIKTSKTGGTKKVKLLQNQHSFLLILPLFSLPPFFFYSSTLCFYCLVFIVNSYKIHIISKCFLFSFYYHLIQRISLFEGKQKQKTDTNKTKKTRSKSI